jgi:hypothetical protein
MRLSAAHGTALQWGRDLIVAETEKREGGMGEERGFNGAAT